MSAPSLSLSEIPDGPKDSLTIVIPSKGRPEKLRALLRYFQLAGIDYKILVLLSGDEDTLSKEIFFSLDVTFLQYDKDADFYHKVREGLRQITTPFVAMCTDDDLVLRDGLSKSAGFLLQNQDFSACQGYHAMFLEEANTVNLASIAYYTPSLLSDLPFDRFKDLISRYQPVCWAVFRTECMLKITREWKRYENLVFNELLWSATAVALGKVARLPLIYCLRRLDPINLSGHPFFALVESPKSFFQDYATYRGQVLDLLNAVPKYSLNQTERVFDLLHFRFLSAEIIPGTLNHFTETVYLKPDISIRDPEMKPFLGMPQPSFESGWTHETELDGIQYRRFPQFQDPLPEAEITLPKDFAVNLISDIDRYFRAGLDLSRKHASGPPERILVDQS